MPPLRWLLLITGTALFGAGLCLAAIVMGRLPTAVTLPNNSANDGSVAYAYTLFVGTLGLFVFGGWRGRRGVLFALAAILAGLAIGGVVLVLYPSGQV